MVSKIVFLILLLVVLAYGTIKEPALSAYEQTELNRYCKENNVIIKGIPDKRGQENLYTVVGAVALRVMRYSRINASEIEAVYRLPIETANATQSRPIIVKLINPWAKLQLIVANRLHVQQIRTANDTDKAELVVIEHYEPAECTELMLKNSKRFQFYNLHAQISNNDGSTIN